MKRPLVTLATLSLLAPLAAAPLHAAGPQFWRIEGAAAFLAGDLNGLSVDSEGRVRLGSSPRQIFDPAAPNGWAVARHAAGNLYLGTGNDGRVMRVQGSSGSVLFDSDELEVHAVAACADGKVYAGTSPDGAVYAIDPSGKASRFFDPQEKYIWALACDSEANLYVATGAEARVYRVGRDGVGAAVLSSTDTHLLSLALDTRGGLYAGSGPEGIVYHLDEAGRTSVLLDSSFREIRALETSPGGIYAAAIDASTTETTSRPAVAAAAAAAVGTAVPEVTVTETFTVVPQGGAAAGPAPEAAAQAPPKGALLWISDGGDVETLWTSPDDVPYALSATADGVLVGTGGKGKLYRVTRNHDWTLAASVAAEQVTALVRSGQDVVVGTSNPARVYALRGMLAAEGTFVSEVRDAATFSRWGQVTWEGRTPPGTAVRLETRSGNTAHPDATWSDWHAHATGEALPATPARFLQIRLTLKGENGATPCVEAVSASYLQRNLPPEVKSVTVHPAGEVFQKPISVSGDPEILGLDPDPLADRSPANRAAAASSPPAITFSRKMFQRGMRTLSWQAEDQNGDDLVYEVQYRALGDERWRTLRRGLTDAVLAWDTSTVPNGRYVLRVLATDGPGNPPSLALAGSKDSASFEVDNTPPTIAASLEQQRIRATARDDSPLRRLEISVDAGRWEDVYPLDGLADSPLERYEIAPHVSGAGPHVVMLRATDVLGNAATVRVDVP